MNDEKMRQEFEAEWGFTNEEQDLYFVPELNVYGSENVNPRAGAKSSAWYYFQLGWNHSRGALLVDFSSLNVQHASFNQVDCYAISDVKKTIERSGLQVKL